MVIAAGHPITLPAGVHICITACGFAGGACAASVVAARELARYRTLSVRRLASVRGIWMMGAIVTIVTWAAGYLWAWSRMTISFGP